MQSEGAHFCKGCGARMFAAPAAGGAASGQQAWMPLTGMPDYPAGYGGYVPLMEARRERVRQNLQPLGITWCLWGLYRLLMGMVTGFAFHEWSRHRVWFGDSFDFAPHFLGVFMPAIALTTVVMASLALLTGYGLLTQKPWARTLAIVMAILALIKIPLGTALGIYTLWVLGPRVSGMEYDGIVRGGPKQG